MFRQPDGDSDKGVKSKNISGSDDYPFLQKLPKKFPGIPACIQPDKVGMGGEKLETQLAQLPVKVRLSGLIDLPACADMVIIIDCRIGCGLGKEINVEGLPDPVHGSNNLLMP